MTGSKKMSAQKMKKPIRTGVVKVPVVMQQEALECGAACLCMVMAYYEKWISLEQVRLACGVSRDGSNAGDILKAARGYGLNAKGYRFEPEELRREGHFPCIIHWDFSHFVVCDGFRGNKVYLNDPARGEISVSIEQFDESFTGVTLMMEPTEQFEPGGKQRSIAAFAKERLTGANAAIAFVVTTSVIATLAGIIQSGFSRVFLDYLLPGTNPAWVTPFFFGFSLLIAIQLVSSFIQSIYLRRLNGKMAAVGNAAFIWKILRLPMSFFSQRMVGDIEGRKESNSSIAEKLVSTLAPLAIEAAMMVFYLVVMFRYSWLLTVIAIGSIAVNLLLSLYISKKRVNITRVAMRDHGKLAGATTGALDMIETIKASGAENGYFERWSGYQASVNTQNYRRIQMSEYWGLLPNAINTVSNTLILVLGVSLVMQGEFTVGMILAFKGIMARFMKPAANLITAGQTIQELRSEMERVEDVMKYPDDPMLEQQREEPKTYDKLSGRLSMRHVTFGYSRLEPPLIEDFNLELLPGHRVAFVGFSGCGKSTLAKLISGLYQPWSGEILLDDQPLATIDRNVLTGSVAVVDQDITLFEDTIANNIKMWDNSIQDFEMILAARDARIHDDIMLREDGYQYMITEGGKNFSGGQRQRLEIARVLAQDPTLLIMDEATSALDARTESEMVEAIMARGISCVVIAHRLSTIRDCDEIIVMDKGKVVERGTHEQLMKNGGLYTELVRSE